MARSRKAGDPKLCIGLIRVSTEEQHLGPEAQRQALARWCAANGSTLVGVFEDLGVSGGAPLEKRVGLLEAVDALRKHGAGVLLVAKRDRLARDIGISALIERLVEREGARVQSADGAGNGDGPEAMLMRGMIDLFAAYERVIIKARTKASLRVKKNRGERTGGVPFGFRVTADGRCLVEDAAEQDVIRDVLRLRAEGLTIKAITDRLNADGVPARGQRWHATSVSRLLRGKGSDHAERRASRFALAV